MVKNKRKMWWFCQKRLKFICKIQFSRRKEWSNTIVTLPLLSSSKAITEPLYTLLDGLSTSSWLGFHQQQLQNHFIRFWKANPLTVV